MQALDNLVARVLAPLDGYKTKLGSFALGLVAINHVFPIVGEPTANLIQNAALALSAYGLRDAIQKNAPP